nr:MAG TPA: hypothetical protein [Caudoviricetes sp.]
MLVASSAISKYPYPCPNVNIAFAPLPIRLFTFSR